jgi:hypothetical protein
VFKGNTSATSTAAAAQDTPAPAARSAGGA